MATFGQDTYALKFSSDYQTLEIWSIASNQATGTTYDLHQQVRIEILNGAYEIDYQEISPANAKNFLPGSFDPDQVAEPLRFVGNDWIGSSDIRDQRVYNEYQYHLDQCAITLQYSAGTAPKITARTICDGSDCTVPGSACRSTEEKTL